MVQWHKACRQAKPSNDTFEADFGVSLRPPQLPIGSKTGGRLDAASDSQDGLTTG
jgi:hypothetical protein